MNIRAFLDSIKDFADLEWAEEWDNSGIMVGSLSWEVSKIGVALDALEDTMVEAVRNSCDLLVVHHPLIFSPLMKIDMSDLSSRLVYYAIEKKLGVISLHTNWDVSPKGVNVCLAESISISRMSPLIPSSDSSWGMGISGRLEPCLPMDSFAVRVKKRWNLSWLRVYGSANEPVRNVALCGGSGGELWKQAFKKGADTYITADMKYHQILEACSMGMRVMLVDHGEMEKVSIPALADLISENTGFPVKLLDSAGPECRII